jgi:hypothetical protein
MLKKIFLALKKRIETETELPVYWYSEAKLRESDTNEELFKCPSVHIELENMNAARMTHQQQRFDATISIHIVEESLYEHEDEETFVKVIDRSEQVHAALHLFSASVEYLTEDPADTVAIFNQLHRTQMRVDHSPSNLYITVMQYKCIAYDLDNMPVLIRIEPPITLNISTEIN